MTIHSFLNLNLANVKMRIIDQMDNSFNSHDFIESFAEQYETEYIDFLDQYKGNKAFQTVHSQIGKFLKEHENELGIVGSGKTDNKNVFGNLNGIEKWKKV